MICKNYAFDTRIKEKFDPMEEKNSKIRVQKFMADNGIASRRKCEEYILQGRVKINGNVITELGVKIDPEIDKIEFDNNKVNKVNNKVYILLNKPIGYVTTAKDQFNRNTVMDLIKVKERVVPVRKTRYVYVWSFNIN